LYCIFLSSKNALVNSVHKPNKISESIFLHAEILLRHFYLLIHISPSTINVSTYHAVLKTREAPTIFFSKVNIVFRCHIVSNFVLLK